MRGEDLFREYKCAKGIWDEMCQQETIRSHYRHVFENIKEVPVDVLFQKEKQAAELFMNQGITFTVYSDDAGIERIFPFDIIPRVLKLSEWQHIEKGIKQRLRALNLFLKDIYSEQQILKDKIIPAELILK